MMANFTYTEGRHCRDVCRVYACPHRRLDEWLPRRNMKIDDPKIVKELEKFVASNKDLQQRIDRTADWLIQELDLKPAK